MAQLELSIRNEIGEYKTLTPKVMAFLRKRAIPASVAYAVRVAVEELVVNAIRYAFDDRDRDVHVIDVSLALEPEHIVVRVEDDGRFFDPREAPAPDLSGSLGERRVGGWGIYLVRSLSEEIRYERRGDRNHVEVWIQLAPAVN